MRAGWRKGEELLRLGGRAEAEGVAVEEEEAQLSNAEATEKHEASARGPT